ncbi:MAG: hypothetical protein HY744_25465 [Deltaproteobacteria bacterium]|nr:hypothetical protein [Deltaproteobacteria bacterium]
MICWHRRPARPLAWAAAVGISSLVLAPEAWAKPPAGTGDTPPPAEKKAGEEDEKAGEDEDVRGKSQALPPPDLGGWGVGGDEEKGRFSPQGKTGRLKELEDAEGKVRGEEAPVKPGPAGHAYLDAAIGLGSIRVPVNPTGSTQIAPAASFIFAAGYRIGDVFGLGLRFPVSTGAVDGPLEPAEGGIQTRDKDAYKRIATGAFEIAVRPTFLLGSYWRLPLVLAFAMPTASGDMFAGPDSRADIGTAIVNQAAAASRGFKERALFSPHRMGVTPGGGILFDRGSISASAETKVELMFRVGGSDPPPPPTAPGVVDPQYEARGAAFNWVTDLGFYYHFMDELVSPGAHLWLAVGSATDSAEAVDYGGAQAVLEPAIKTAVPLLEGTDFAIDAELSWIVPLGGELGGANQAFAHGPHLRAGVVF